MENLTIDLEELYQEVKERAFAEGAFGREEWRDLVEVVLDEKREFDEMHDDTEWVETQEALEMRFSDFQLEIPEV